VLRGSLTSFSRWRSHWQKLAPVMFCRDRVIVPWSVSAAAVKESSQ
jgi:hypothetical protein